MPISKKLFFLFLAANIILLLWEGSRARHTGTSSTYRGAPVERLELLQEMAELPRKSRPPRLSQAHDSVAGPTGARGTQIETADQGRETTDLRQSAEVEEITKDTEESLSPKVENRTETIQCFRVGPFADRSAAEVFLATLGERGIKGLIKPETETEVVGYWIMYPPAASLSEARETLNRLESQGFEDLWLFEQGPFKGAISLGLYAMQSRAEVMAARMRKRGLEVKVMPKQQVRKTYWLRLDRPVSPVWMGNYDPTLRETVCDVQSVREEPISSEDSGSLDTVSGRE